ncbi:MAG: hypothetical protein EON51_18325 [Acinetobacter sp.]|nr:MAG: hypothetical protein EON51_18325 [Acinetobacter sp.]
MKKVMMITCAFLWLGCGSINKDKLFSKSINKERVTKESSELIAIQEAINIRDSNDNTMELTIWPKGPFTFSPAAGFTGEAFKMEVKGRQSSLIKKSELSSVKRSATTKQKLQEERVVKLKEKQVGWEGMGYGVGVLAVIVVVIVVWIVWKKLS